MPTARDHELLEATAAPPLSFLRSIVTPTIETILVEPIKRSSTPASVHRLRLLDPDDEVIQSLILKRIDPDWPDDPLGYEREASFYRLLLPQLDIPHPYVYYAGPEPDSAAQMVILEDIGDRYRFPQPDYVWAQAEIEQVLCTYARLHSSGFHYLPPEGKRDWLVARHEKRLLQTASDIPQMVDAIVENGIWMPIDGLSWLLEKTVRNVELYADQPVTLLHNDVYPPNCSIPLLDDAETILVDWDMVGHGLAEMDLAFMFMQPFGSHRRLNRQAALEYYWRQRQQLDGKRPSKSELKARQQYADALWSLWLIPVAYRMMQSPFPIGAAARSYWDSMFTILGEELHRLSNDS